MESHRLVRVDRELLGPGEQGPVLDKGGNGHRRHAHAVVGIRHRPLQQILHLAAVEPAQGERSASAMIGIGCRQIRGDERQARLPRAAGSRLEKDRHLLGGQRVGSAGEQICEWSLVARGDGRDQGLHPSIGRPPGRSEDGIYRRRPAYDRQRHGRLPADLPGGVGQQSSDLRLGPPDLPSRHRSERFGADARGWIAQQTLYGSAPLVPLQSRDHATDRLPRSRHGIFEQQDQILRVRFGPEAGEGLNRGAADPIGGVTQAGKQFRDRLPAADFSERLDDPGTKRPVFAGRQDGPQDGTCRDVPDFASEPDEKLSAVALDRSNALV